ncbi:MAG: site-specific DNA-methyltransferase [Novosphingobium sp.]|uniref:site-specific DNA-methyltransferase n=1 Tax=Novosphingobium sp. TaxID=1874826 RepID=UPI003017C9ED
MANNFKSVEAFKHDDAKRKNIPSVEQQSFVQQEQQAPRKVRYPRNTDLDPQLVWRGKDEQDWSDLVVNAPPLYIQEKVHPKALVDDLLRQSRESEHEAGMITPDLFSDFNGIPKDADKTEFYTHDQNWTNRMILGDSLQIMASLSEREGLRGKVQCIYIDPPYGIKFNSNFQWSTTSRDVKDGQADHITREPEQVKAFRDTWRDGIHSYLTYLRDRLTVVRDLLSDTGSVFVQIGDENVHRVRALMDEIFGDSNFISNISFRSMSPLGATRLTNVYDHILWYAKNIESAKYRNIYQPRAVEDEPEFKFVSDEAGFVYDLNSGRTPPEGTKRVFKRSVLMSSGFTPTCFYKFQFEGKEVSAANKSWRTNATGMERLIKANRLIRLGRSVYFRQYHGDFGLTNLENVWTDTAAGFSETKTYVVQTHPKIIQRCILMTTDPGDLVIDPTCGSGTTAYIAEQWGRRWITMDTSRVALALARARIMGARFPYYFLADTPEGRLKEAEVTQVAPSSKVTHGSLQMGFVYERKARVYLRDIANNTEIDVIWDRWSARIFEALGRLNLALKKDWKEWEVPSEPSANWTPEVKSLYAEWRDARKRCQIEIDASIAAKAEFEHLYDRPYEDRARVRVAGPFTVESLSPHRTLGVDENDELIDSVNERPAEYSAKQTFEQMILENLKSAGVQQAHKEDRITFTSLVPWPGTLVCAEGRFFEGPEEDGRERRAAIFIGPEFGTVQRADLVAAAREAGDAGFDALIACAFNYEAHATEFSKLGRIPVLKARMNADLHMAEDLKNTGKGNLFVIFGEPDITILPQDDGRICVKVNGVDVFKPQTGEVVSDGADGIACWFIDTDYNEESFFVRHAYFLGANDPYSSLKTTLKAEINGDAWATLNSDTSRPFEKPKSGRFAVKVINHLGDEVMKVFRI